MEGMFDYIVFGGTDVHRVKSILLDKDAELPLLKHIVLNVVSFLVGDTKTFIALTSVNKTCYQMKYMLIRNNRFDWFPYNFSRDDYKNEYERKLDTKRMIPLNAAFPTTIKNYDAFIESMHMIWSWNVSFENVVREEGFLSMFKELVHFFVNGIDLFGSTCSNKKKIYSNDVFEFLRRRKYLVDFLYDCEEHKPYNLIHCLNIRNMDIIDEKIAKHLKGIHTLDVSNCESTGATDIMIKELSGIHTLSVGKFSSKRFSSKSFKYLRHLNSIIIDASCPCIPSIKKYIPCKIIVEEQDDNEMGFI